MKPKGAIICPEYKNNGLTASFSLSWDYAIEIPVRLLFERKNIRIEMWTTVKMPISSATELIRTADLAEDYLQQMGVAQKLEEGQQKILEAIDKVRQWFGVARKEGPICDTKKPGVRSPFFSF